jgi:hypothetical protein
MEITVIQSSIRCEWTGRHGGDVTVFGAGSIKEAREHALKFFREDEEGGCDDEGITLDDGCFITWKYEEEQPSDWQDYYVFSSCDAHPVDQREWWEK